MHDKRAPSILVTLRWGLPLLGVLLAAPAWAESLTLPQSVAAAAQRQPALRLAQTDVLLAGNQIEATRAGQRPTLNLESGYLGSSTRSGALDFIANNAPHEVRLQMLGRWPLDTGQLGARIRQAEAEQEAARWGMEAARLDMGRLISEAYFGVLKAQSLVVSYQSALQDAQAQARGSGVRFRAGAATRLDLSQSEQLVATQQANLAGASADLEAARARFRVFTGASPAFTLVEPPGAPPKAPPEVPLTERPDVRQAQSALLARQHEVQAAMLLRRPQLALSSAVGWDTAGLPQPQTAGAQLGVDLSWPLVQGGVWESQVRTANLGIQRAELELERLGQQATLELTDARAQLTKATSQYAALSRAQGLAAQSLAMARFGYREGTISLLEVLTAQRALLDARIALQNARYDAYLAEARLRLATGGTL